MRRNQVIKKLILYLILLICGVLDVTKEKYVFGTIFIVAAVLLFVKLILDLFYEN